ncbi:hypothetical protein RvY_17378 [Ramazzottius varieornatus]|uniref:Uncharacterized protein n=1 Tax=Ramazzottius varieornatus TaxID=947166 RepID=A0A1D1W1X5_RAMVA|nr:hypothetical protein RvY_17378 [Ramazzottius varieornatus]
MDFRKIPSSSQNSFGPRSSGPHRRNFARNRSFWDSVAVLTSESSPERGLPRTSTRSDGIRFGTCEQLSHCKGLFHPSLIVSLRNQLFWIGVRLLKDRIPS